MRIVPLLTCSAVLAATVALAGVTAGAPKHHLNGQEKESYAIGQTLVTQDRCNRCHRPNLKGHGATPSLLPDGPMRHYTRATFTRLLGTGIDFSGKKIGPPMSRVCKLGSRDSAALYMYLSNQ
ncbi:MAG: c-type cytochrome [Capsulimonadaceae bacterium]